MILELLFLSRIKERKRKGKEGRKEGRERKQKTKTEWNGVRYTL